MRLIDADAFMDTIRKHDYILKDFYNGTDKGMFTTGIEQAVSEQPTIDAVPVVHGKWMPIYEANEFGDVYQSGIYCSECSEQLGREANFCPNCGAMMHNPCTDCQEFDCYGCEYKKGARE